MASPLCLQSLFLFTLLFNLTSTEGGKIIFEDGYTVTTVFDGDKSSFKVNPHAIFHGSSSSEFFIILDSVASAFYTLSLPTTSNETEIQRLAGNGEPNYADGDLHLARFNKPKSFAVDHRGNLYVADQRNHAIRKITKSGVTTIAGGYSQKAGRTDGPARHASFSDDFELTFVPERCALMISDHGNRLVRQINLKAEDCTRNSGSVLGTTPVWILAMCVLLSCLLGLIIGFVIRPYVTPSEGFEQLPSTWTYCLMSLERTILILCSGIRSAVVKSAVYSMCKQIILLSLSLVSLMFAPRISEKSCTTSEKPVSLLDFVEPSSSVCSSNTAVSSKVDDQLKDLLDFDGGLVKPVNASEVFVKEVGQETTDVSPWKQDKINSMICANLIDFEEQAPRVCSPEYLECNLGLVKRR